MKPQYEPPAVKVVGEVTKVTQTKPGIYFDSPGAQQGETRVPPPGTPGTS
ncbi:MAG: lasso RiPP family leader peptide-containing protein [Solirubrobacteraceae bacterium]|nr:lasso RiPP family leader peptide-containing protein [Solirubrobacteraceae bacterium]